MLRTKFFRSNKIQVSFRFLHNLHILQLSPLIFEWAKKKKVSISLVVNIPLWNVPGRLLASTVSLVSALYICTYLFRFPSTAPAPRGLLRSIAVSKRRALCRPARPYRRWFSKPYTSGVSRRFRSHLPLALLHVNSIRGVRARGEYGIVRPGERSENETPLWATEETGK